MVILAFLPMGMERLLPTGKQRFVCDRFFQGEIAWGGGDFHGCLKNTKKRKKKKGKRKQQQQQQKQTNKQNFHDRSWGNFYGLNKNPLLNQSQKVKCTKKYTQA